MRQSSPQTLAPISPPRSQRRLLLLGTIVVGLVCQVAVVGWVIATELPAKVMISAWSLSMPAIMLLVLGIAAHRRAVVRRWLGERRQLLLIYSMVSVAGVLAGFNQIPFMFPVLAALRWRGTGSGWSPLMERLPAWLLPRDEAVIRGLFMGGQATPWAAWLVPLACWLLWLMALYSAMLFLSVLLSRQWIHGERLTFPIAQIPLEMTAPGGALFRQRLFWIGMAIPAVLDNWTALSHHLPSLPALALVHRDLQPDLFPDRPWSALRPIYTGFAIPLVGFGYLAPLDVSFSIAAFSLLARGERVYGAMMGWDLPGAGPALSRFPFGAEQSYGAFVTFAALALWRSWPGLRETLGKPYRGPEERRVAVLALLGFTLSVAVVLVGFRLAGMAWWVAGVTLSLTLLVTVSLTRIRAEAGPAWTYAPYPQPSRFLLSGLGSANLSTPSITVLAAFHWFNFDGRFSVMPFQMEGLKLAEQTGLRRRTFMLVMLAATAVGVTASMVTALYLGYRLTWASGKIYDGPLRLGAVIWDEGMRAVSNPRGANVAGAPWVLGGGLFTALLMMLRARWLWWPLHPIGYVVAETGMGFYLWCDYLVAWLLKAAVLRYGGHRLYARTIPLCVGAILGDLLTQGLWSLASVALGLPGIDFIPYQ